MPAEMMTQAAFSQFGLESKTLRSADFWSDDCIRCAPLSPIMDTLTGGWDAQTKAAQMWLHPEMPLVSAYRILGDIRSHE